MAAIFPLNPTYGQLFVYGSNTYFFDGNGWVYKPDLYLNGINIRDKLTFSSIINFNKNYFRYFTEVSVAKTIEFVRPTSSDIFEFEIEIKVLDAILVSFSSDFTITDSTVINARGIYLMQCIYDNGICYAKLKMTYAIPIVFLNYNIISTGQYLNTGIVMNNDPIRIEISCKIGNANNDSIFGARSAGGTERLSLAKDATLANINFYYGTANNKPLTENTANDVFIFDGTLLWINGVSTTITKTNINSATSLALFGLNSGGTITAQTNIKKISYFKMYKSDVLVCDYVAIPNGFEYLTGQYATQNGFFDKVSQTVKYGNSPFAIETI